MDAALVERCYSCERIVDQKKIKNNPGVNGYLWRGWITCTKCNTWICKLCCDDGDCHYVVFLINNKTVKENLCNLCYSKIDECT